MPGRRQVIPKHLYRRLLDLDRPFTVTDSDDAAHSVLRVEIARGGEVALMTPRDMMMTDSSEALDLINAWMIADPNDRRLGGSLGFLDTGKCPCFTIASERPRPPLPLSVLIAGNRTQKRYNDVAYIHVTAGRNEAALYEMFETDDKLCELDSYSLKCLPRHVHAAIAIVGHRLGDFDPEAAFIKEYGADALSRARAISDADRAAFLARLADARHQIST